MNKPAKQLFKELGYELYSVTDDDIIYKYHDDCFEESIHFELGLKRVCMHYADWIPNEDLGFVPMEERNPNYAESTYYGHWQAGTFTYLDGNLILAISKQMKELEWI